MNGYSVTIVETSKQLTAKERIAIKDTSDAIKLDLACEDQPVEFEVDFYAILNIHNEKSDDKEYNSYIFVSKTGEKYVTGSESFFSAFINIYEEMKNESEDWGLKAYKLDSKNYKGKKFLTCSII